MPLSEQAPHVFKGSLGLAVGELAAAWRRFGAQVIVGHPTFRNADNIGRQLAEGIRGAQKNFGGRKVAFVVSDGSWTAASGDQETVDAALAAARAALEGLAPEARELVHVTATPYEGYADDTTPGKGSALKMIFDEMGSCEATLLILLDGDLRNDMALWHGVFARVEAEHSQKHLAKAFFVTARYARHFVDASLTRNIVGPLTTLMGQYVPGGISGDIALSCEAVVHERASTWTDARRKYGTDISTTFDNIADPNTVIYEIYLGAKLHDITDDAKLAIMPGEVIGAALERLLYWEQMDGRVIRGLEGGSLTELEIWPPKRTHINFVDPGYTDVFDVDAKMDTLLDNFDKFAEVIRLVQGPEVLARLEARHRELAALRKAGTGPVAFLGVDASQWIEMMQRAVAYLFVHKDVNVPKRCLNYLYTAAFLEFVKERLIELGAPTVEAVRAIQGNLGVPEDRAEAFYTDSVDGVVRRLALDFYERRGQIKERIAELQK